MRLRRLLFVVVLLTLAVPSFAQYYGTGQSPYYIKWRQRETQAGTLIYPDYYERGARKLQMVYDSLSPTINYGLTRSPLTMPIVVHGENVSSNGLVMLAPKRSELIAIPPIDNYATEWYASLAAHEYRHATQYANLSAHFFKPLSWIIGQQAGLISLAMVPLWYLEGDAVMTETQAASFGRALQPSFTMAYRAYLDEGVDFARDKWFTGSYKNSIPSYYNLGYQLVRYGNELYGDDMWNTIIDYTSRYPYTILAKSIAMKKYFGTSTDKLLDGAMAQMADYWAALPERENSSAQLVAADKNNFETYSSPVVIDSERVYALKTDYKRSARIVAVDRADGSETIVANVGDIYTPLSRSGNRLLWSEQRQSTLWDHKITTALCYYDLETGAKGDLKVSQPNPMFPVQVADTLIYISYDYSGVYSLVVGDESFELEGVGSVHGLAYDQKTQTLAAIILSSEGMSIVALDMDSGARKNIKPASRVTLSDLSAGQGMLTFGSIASGYDEVHTLDLSTGLERRLTTSRYGSFNPSAPTQEGEVYLATYSTEGYLLSSQMIDIEKDSVVEDSHLPLNIVNLPTSKWPVANVDSLSMSIAEAVDLESKEQLEAHSCPYCKTTHLINVHSWFPLGFNPYDIVDESDFDFALGATIMSQNALGTMTATASYRYTDLGHSLSGNISYEALPVKFDLDVEYGGGKQLAYGDYDWENYDRDENLALSVQAYVPITLDGGYHTRALTPIVEYTYSNALTAADSISSPSEGFGYMAAALIYSDYVSYAYRDFLPRWGYNFKLLAMADPFGDDTAQLYALRAGVYMPSFAAQHSININAAVQKQEPSTLNFYHKELYPRGADYSVAAGDYYASTFDYNMPLAYPDWGLNSIFYIKRIRLGTNFDYARFRKIDRRAWTDVNSYGATIYFDMHVLRVPANTSTFSFSIYKASDTDGVTTGINFSLPL